METSRDALPEVIEISSDESDDEVMTQNNQAEPLPWSNVVTRLLVLAKDRDLLDKTQEISILLREMRIPPSIDVCRALQDACEELGQLLEISEGRARRYQANEALAVVLCEVLSLVQTLPMEMEMTMDQKVNSADPMQELLYLMDKWSYLLAEIRAAISGRQSVIDRTMAWLEGLIAQCSREIEEIEGNIGLESEERENSAQKCCDELERCAKRMSRLDLAPGDRAFQIFNEAFAKTDAIQAHFARQVRSVAALKRQQRGIAHQHQLFQAVLKLACVVAQQTSAFQQIKDEACAAKDKLSVLTNDILHFIDDFCDILQSLMSPSRDHHTCSPDSATPSTEGEDVADTSVSLSERRAEHFNFAERLELFWRIHKNQLPPPVLDVVSRSFGTLARANAQKECPINTAVSRVSEELWATFVTLK